MANIDDLIKSSNTGLSDISSKLSEISAKTDDATKKTGEYTASMDKFGATANTALGLVSASIKDTNPQLASMLGSVQKLIPNLVEVGNAAKQTGSLIKGMTSTAGILALITLITTLITDFDNIAEAIGFSSEQIEDFKVKAQNALDKVVSVVAGVGNAIADFILAPFNGIVEAIEVFKEKGVKGIGDAAKAFGSAFSEGFKFKANYQTGETAGADWIAGVHSNNNKKKAKEAGKAVGDAVTEGIADAVAAVPNLVDVAEIFADLEAQLKERGTGLKSELQSIFDEIWAQDTEDAESMPTLADQILGEAQAEEDRWEKSQQHLKDFGDLLSNTSTLVHNVGESYTDSIEEQVEAGKMSVKEGKKQLKAQAAIEASLTLAAGIASSIYSMKSVWKDESLSLEAKIAASVATVASVLATTYSSVKSIQQAGQGLSSATVSTSAVSSTPTVTFVANPTSNADVVSAVQDNTAQAAQTQVVLVVDDYKKVADNATTVAVQSAF